MWDHRIGLVFYSILVLFFLISIPAADAANFTAVQNGNWDNPATWGNAIPGDLDDKIIPNKITVTIITEVINSGTINNSGLLIVSSDEENFDITTGGTLKNMGILNNFSTGVIFIKTIKNIGIQNTSNISNSGTIYKFCGAEYDGILPDGNKINDLCSPCNPPSFGSWTINSSCFLSRSAFISGNVTIQNNSLVLIPAGITFGIDLKKFNVIIKPDSSILINSGGKLTDSNSDFIDFFGIKKIYTTKVGGSEWFVDMTNPLNNIENTENLQLTLQSDGSWEVNPVGNSGQAVGQVRMEVKSLNKKWLNSEMTLYGKITNFYQSNPLELFQLLQRGGEHSDSCIGSAYKAAFYGDNGNWVDFLDNTSTFIKEIKHPVFATPQQGRVELNFDTVGIGKWVGLKFVVYNFIENGNTFVRLESYIDRNVTDPNGNLVIGNNWELVTFFEDRGGWSTPIDVSDCPPLSIDNKDAFRHQDEILSLPGGNPTHNVGIFRTDNIVWNFKYLSMREIQPPIPIS